MGYYNRDDYGELLIMIRKSMESRTKDLPKFMEDDNARILELEHEQAVANAYHIKEREAEENRQRIRLTNESHKIEREKAMRHSQQGLYVQPKKVLYTWNMMLIDFHQEFGTVWGYNQADAELTVREYLYRTFDARDIDTIVVSRLDFNQPIVSIGTTF